MEIKQSAKFDIQTDTDIKVDFKRLVTRISNTVDNDSSRIEAGYGKNPHIDFYHAQAKFVSNKIVEVDGAHITADKIIVAVGSRPQIPPIEGLIDTPFMTSNEALRRTDLPRSMIMIGAGFIAVELGHAYGALGTQTHFLVRNRFLGKVDEDISDEFTREFSKHHQVSIGVITTKVEYRNKSFTVTYKDKTGKTRQAAADALLVATGVASNADNLNLCNTDIQVSKGNFIKVDDYLQTTVKGVYALGDCIGRYFFRHSVNFEGEYLFKTLFTEKLNVPIRYPPIPNAIFTYPQVAGVGKTENQLKMEGVDYVAGVNHYSKSAMGMALLSDHGFCKILIDRQSQKILGAHIVGAEASNMIHMLIAFMCKDGTLDDLLDMVYIHPALPEIVRNAARKAKAVLEDRVTV